MNEPGPVAGTATSATGRRVWLGVGAVLTLAALVIGAMGVMSAGWAALERESADASFESYSHPVSRVELDSAPGSVSLSGTGHDEVDVRRKVTWTGPEPEADETWSGDTFVVETTCPDSFPQWVSRTCSVDYSVRLPAAVDAAVRTTTAPIDVRRLDGELDLTATTGAISVDGASGPLSARTTTGGVTGSDLRSPQVDAEVTTGELVLSFTEPPDRVTAVSTTGDVTIEVPRADGPYRVEVRTSTGEQRVDVAQDPQADPDRVIDVTTTTGDVHIRYPNGGGR